MALPAFYLFLGSHAGGNGTCTLPGYPGAVLTHWTRFAAVNTISLCCRKVFDDTKGQLLNGAAFGRLREAELHGVAAHWAKRADRTQVEALAALLLMRDIFKACAGADGDLLSEGASTLAKRVGLLKQHANRSAAHISLGDFEFSPADCAHVVGALTLLGEVVRTFDDPGRGADYFNQLDAASLAAAKALFPETPDLRLFGHINVAEQAAMCWHHEQTGREMILERLPYAMSWF
jgi:hypothetical protein